MARGKRNTAALAALLGAGALASRKGVDLGPLPEFDSDAFERAYGIGARPTDLRRAMEGDDDRALRAEVGDVKRYVPAVGPYKKGGKVSASSRGDGIARRGKTRGRLL
jgi:hypothetical protein